MSLLLLNRRWIIALVLVAVCASILISSQPVHAQGTNAGIFGKLPSGTGLTPINNPDDIYGIIGNLIKTFLGVLGIIAFGLILYAGYLWMTAQGESEKVEKAQQILVEATIGLIIIAASWAIASFVTTKISNSISATPSTSEIIQHSRRV